MYTYNIICMYQKVLYFENSDGGHHWKKNARIEEEVSFVPTEKKGSAVERDCNIIKVGVVW